SMEGNSRMVYLNPYEGGTFIVAEVCRNLACVGAKPMGITDCLNFGNPERPEVMWQMEQAIKGMSEACQKLGVPIVSGNVSLYNETVDREGIRNIYPTPVVAGVGVVENRKFVDHKFKEEGDLIFLLGDLKRPSKIDGSEFLKVVYGKVMGDVPLVDLDKERKLHQLLLKLIEMDIILSAHDISTGGLLVCLLECLFGTSLGANINLYTDERIDFFLFSENPTRAVVSIKQEDAEVFKDMVEAQGLDWILLGRTTDYGKIKVELYDEPVLDEDLKKLEDLWKNSLEKALSHIL
ncbi:MAG: AIR synthase related protein, partial [Hydrogenobacter thermophilus]|nr:AIR synthase related protein [Hydrogenobacter thermophilus]